MILLFVFLFFYLLSGWIVQIVEEFHYKGTLFGKKKNIGIILFWPYTVYERMKRDRRHISVHRFLNRR